MGLARDLTMGRRRGRSTVGRDGDYAILHSMTERERLGLPVDAPAMRAILDRIGSQPGRMRFIEGARYTEGCEAYSRLTGARYGPQRTQV